MFTHLHVHSHYSLLDGLAKIDELIEAAKKYNMDSLALTDHGVMYGAIEFYKKAKKAGIKPIIGVEAYVARHGLEKKRSNIDKKPFHLILLAKNQTGYKNLLKLTSIAHLKGFYYKPRIDHEALKKYNKGIIALSGCIQGEVAQAVLNHKFETAKKIALKYQETFGKGNFYLELQPHEMEEQKKVNKGLLKISKQTDIPVVATADIHYPEEKDGEAQDVLLCLQTKKKIKDQNRMNMMDEDYSFKSPKKMKNFFKEVPEAIKNTEDIAKRCNLEIELGKPKLPSYPKPEDKSYFEVLKEMIYKKVKQRYPKEPKKVKDRIEHELKIIKKTGFSSYFLIVQDFVNWAKEQEIVVGPGRGSAAGSIVSYILGITNIDPLEYGLIFERFLTEGRIALPDIDLDFADTRRDEVIEYVEKKYGRDHIAQIITFGTMAARGSIRDVGRVLDFSYNFCDRLAKLVPFGSTLKQALENPDFKKMYNNNKDAKEIIDMAQRIEGVARHASKHACGLLITPEPTENYVPVQYDVSGGEKTIITQYEKNAIEDLGLLKMDFLGLKNLTIIENALKIIKARKGKDININEIPLNDKKAFKLLQKGDTTGVFQLESPGMRQYLKKLKPTEINDIISMVALYRPGPMKLIPDYIAGKHGKKKPTYIHPKLKPILKPTYGIAIYQEQLLQISRDLAGFSLSEADVLRKAVGKKITKLLKKQKKKFITGCVENGIPKKTAKEIFAFIEPFADYGFNKSHASCYAMIAYQTAYLKANFPTEFMAALLTSDQTNTDKVALQVDATNKMGIEVLPPDVNESFKNFTVVDDKTIRFGLLAIKNVGVGIVEAIIKERKENGQYQTLEGFLSRVKNKDLNKKSLESLTKSGAMDSLVERNQILKNIQTPLDFARKKRKEGQNGQSSLFSLSSNNAKLRLRKTEPASEKQKLLWEKKLLGIFVSGHPLEQYESVLFKYAQPIQEVKDKFFNNKISKKSRIKVAGIITNIKKNITSNKKTMLFVKLEDTTGEAEVIIFPNIYSRTMDLWEESNMVSITGNPSDKDGNLKIIAQKVRPITTDLLDDLLLKQK